MCTVLQATHAETSAQEDYEVSDLVLGIGTTPLKFNIAPEKGPSPKESTHPTNILQGLR